MCPDRTRIWDLATYIRDENPDVVTLPQHFKDNDYEVVGIGKIYDPRNVRTHADAKSWSVPFIQHNSFLNKKYKDLKMWEYQVDDVRTMYNAFIEKAKAEGKSDKEAVKYAYLHAMKTSECLDVPDDAYHDGATVNGLKNYLKSYKGEKPFFLAIGFKKPHLPFNAPKKYWELYDRDKMPLATYRKKALNSPEIVYHKCEELRAYYDIPPLVSFSDVDNVILPGAKQKELVHGYYACISFVDAQLGKIMKMLEAKKIKFHHPIIQAQRVHELIKLIKSIQRDGKRLFVSTSFSGCNTPTPEVAKESDFILLHGNGMKDPKGIIKLAEKTRKMIYPVKKPILINEDDHFDFEKDTCNFTASIFSYVSWGYFDYRMEGEGFDEGYQSLPVNWEISSNRKKAFFEKLKEITGTIGD